jgi:hypothetical protein
VESSVATTGPVDHLFAVTEPRLLCLTDVSSPRTRCCTRSQDRLSAEQDQLGTAARGRRRRGFAGDPLEARLLTTKETNELVKTMPAGCIR